MTHVRTALACAVSAFALAGCDSSLLFPQAIEYEVVTKSSCITTTADNVCFQHENYWFNAGKITGVFFSRDRQAVLYVPGEEFIMYREIRKDKKRGSE